MFIMIVIEHHWSAGNESPYCVDCSVGLSVFDRMMPGHFLRKPWNAPYQSYNVESDQFSGFVQLVQLPTGLRNRFFFCSNKFHTIVVLGMRPLASC